MMCCHFAWVCMYVCMYVFKYIRSLRNAILCLCTYVYPQRLCSAYARVCTSVTLAQLLDNLVAKVSPGTITAPATAGLHGPCLIEHNSLPNGGTSRGCARFNCYSPRRVTRIIHSLNTTCSKVVATVRRPSWADFLCGAGNHCPYTTTAT